jgi:hypothetical protein
LSSTTERRAERGQILIIFAVSLVVVFGIAALVFDGGSLLLEKRAQQNAADAAALAGARFLPANAGQAELAAIDVATANGFTHGQNNQTVTVNIPPQNGPNAGRNGYIEVLIDAEKPSFFSGIWGIFSHDVGSRSVAANQIGVRGPFAMLSLNPTACAAVDIGGQGEIISNGNIQVNSNCPNGALTVRGQGEIVTAPHVACNVVGDFRVQGLGNYNCEVNEGTQAIPDPYAGLAHPGIPTTGTPPVIVYPNAPVQVSGGTLSIPNGCPGSTTPATHTSPSTCQFTAAHNGRAWRLFPGYYPGGISLQGGTFYMEPGIYYMGGGGFRTQGGSVVVRSVSPGGTTLGGGVMIFNGTNPSTTTGAIHLAGGGSDVKLWPLRDGSAWDSIVLFQHRDVCLTVVLNGAATVMEVRGVIYVPCGLVQANGNTGTVMTDQIIADRFQLTGNGGGLTVAYDDDFLPSLSVAGLIE